MRARRALILAGRLPPGSAGDCAVNISIARTVLIALALSSACAQSTQPLSDDAGLAPGAVRVTAVTEGFPKDPDGYRVLLGLSADAPSQARLVAANGAVLMERVAPGNWRLFLEGMQSNCAATLPYPVVVTVTSYDTTVVTMVVHCGPQQLHRTESFGGPG